MTTTNDNASTAKPSMVSLANSLQDINEYKELNWAGSFEDYLQIVKQRPTVTRNAHQRLYDMVMSYGTSEYVDNKKTITHYHFFDDPNNGGAEAIYGIDISLMRFMDVFKSAAMGYAAARRVILMVGPPGSSKSSIARLLKRGLELYSKTDEGAIYSFDWINLKETGLQNEDEMPSQMNEDPLKLFPSEWRPKAVEKLGLSSKTYNVRVDGELDPASRFVFNELLKKYNGNWQEVLEKHIRVRRVTLSEKNRVGIGTFEPKDEKSQDVTELTGDINYRKIAEYGSDADPRGFDFKSGEVMCSNRGIIEFIEMLKLETEFLYLMLELSQSKQCKPRKFAVTDVDTVILGHTNEEEYDRLVKDPYMSALKDRTLLISIPYITKLAEEQKVYLKDFSGDKLKGLHVAPHTITCAAMFSVLSRLDDPKKHNLSLMQKMKLYDGKVLPGYTQDTVKELRKESKREGMSGISPRYIQNKISNAIVNSSSEDNMINPFMILNQLKAGLTTDSLVNDEEKRKRYLELITMVNREYEEIVKNEIQRAISADEDSISRLATNYIDNIKAFSLKEKIKNKYTGQNEEPDERLMRSIEERIDIPASRAPDWRREIMNFVGGMALDGKKFEWHSNDRLRRALELKLFEDSKDTIKLKSFVSNVRDEKTQAQIDVIRMRLIKNFGYNEKSATDVLNYVSSIFARGDVKD